MPPRRYDTVDAMRGVAALAVVVFHLGQVHMQPDFVPHGYLAVDFFFTLSGFVLAHAYEDALGTWLTWRGFLVKRLQRLYPLAFFGAVFGFGLLLFKWHSFPDKVDPLPLILASAWFNFLMLPMVFGGAASRQDLFPGDGPLWSLFFEMTINLLWAWLGVGMRSSALVLVAVVSGAVLSVFAIDAHTVNIGFDVPTFWMGLARVCFGFTVGVLIYRVHTRVYFPAVPGGPFLLVPMLLVVLAFPFDISAGPVPLWDLASVWVMLPIIVMLGIGQRQRNRFGALLGDLSYPIYVLHYPVLLIASGLHQSALSQVDIDVMSFVTYGTVVVLSLVALKFYDEPVRRALAGGKPSARTRKTSEPPAWPGAAGWGDAGAPYFTRPLWSG